MHRIKNIALVLSYALLGSACVAEEAGENASQARHPSVLVEIRGMRLSEKGGLHPNLIVAAWADGRIVWSEDQQDGGPPFREALIDPRKVAELVAAMEKRNVFDKHAFRHSWFGPDSSYHSVWLSNGRKHTRMESWHELYERNPGLVAVGGGLRGLDGRTRAERIAEDKSGFREFRVLWGELRASTTALIPRDGKRLEEGPVLDLPRD